MAPITNMNLPGGVTNLGLTNVGPGSMFTTGDVYFVGSTVANAADDTSNGGNPTNPFSTMDFANGQCTDNNGDIVIVMPGHVETVTAAAGLDLDTIGVSWFGIGYGSDRPQINFTTAVGADMDIDAANVSMDNFLFTGGIDALTGPIDINAADCRLTNIETRDVTGQATDFIVTDANADRLYIGGWYHRGAAGAGADTAITIVGGDDVTIDGAEIYGNFAVAGVENVTTAGVRHRYRNINVWNVNSADVGITLVATTTGDLGPNIFVRVADNAANIDEAVVGDDMQIYGPVQIVNTNGESSFASAIGTYNGNFTASTDA